MWSLLVVAVTAAVWIPGGGRLYSIPERPVRNTAADPSVCLRVRYSVLAVKCLMKCCCLPCLCGVGGTFTSGFPTLDEIRGNGSLLNDGVYSTHDGEIRSVPDVQFTCNGTISKFTFIALPGVGIQNTVLAILRQDNIIRNFNTAGATLSFGDFGYSEQSPPNDVQFQTGDTLQIDHQLYASSRLRILHQVGDDMLDICWRWRNEGPSDTRCELDYDYPLLAVETSIWT